jgi:hypothetical protein
VRVSFLSLSRSPTCRTPLIASAPPLQRQLSAYIDRTREALAGTFIGGESIEDWRARQAAWDERCHEARAQWGTWPEAEEEEEEAEPEPMIYDQTFFKLREVTPLARLKQAFCQRKAVLPHQVDFLFGGAPILDDDTPESLAMVEGDTIDAVWSNGAPPGRERYEIRLAREARGQDREGVHEAMRPAERPTQRQTRGRMSERTARYMRGDGRCLNVCVESWLEDFRNSVQGREEQAANQAHLGVGPGGVPVPAPPAAANAATQAGSSGNPGQAFRGLPRG